MKVKKSTAQARREFAKIPKQCPNCKEMTKDGHAIVQTLEDIMEKRPQQFACEKKETCETNVEADARRVEKGKL